MFTKPIVRRPITIFDEVSKDMNSINRLLAAATISPRYRANLLDNPQQAILGGFGGESFPLSQITYSMLISIKASTLPDFARQLEEKLGNRYRIA